MIIPILGPIPAKWPEFREEPLPDLPAWTPYSLVADAPILTTVEGIKRKGSQFVVHRMLQEPGYAISNTRTGQRFSYNGLVFATAFGATTVVEKLLPFEEEITTFLKTGDLSDEVRELVKVAHYNAQAAGYTLKDAVFPT